MIVGKSDKIPDLESKDSLALGGSLYEKEGGEEFIIDRLPIVNNKLIMNSQGKVTHLIEDDGTNTEILLTENFKEELLNLILARPDTFFVDKNGHLNGFWEFRIERIYRVSHEVLNGFWERRKERVYRASHEPRLNPMDFERVADFQPYKEHTAKWFCYEYDLIKRLKPKLKAEWSEELVRDFSNYQ